MTVHVVEVRAEAAAWRLGGRRGASWTGQGGVLADMTKGKENE